jgi:hypothetical protein
MATSFAHAASKREMLLIDSTGSNVMVYAQLVLTTHSMQER